MEVITIETTAFKQILSSISELKEVLTRKGNCNPLSETWIDISETCMLLKVSKRTLQTYRDNRMLPYSQISGKVYFKVKDIEEFLEKHYVGIPNNKR